jgi:GNAT superfamily N-acetyltransferase
MNFSDLALSKRLERAEGFACEQFARARRRVSPEVGAEWMHHAGANIVFDGPDSPITQTFGLGIFEELTPSALDVIERFFIDRGAPVFHEVSPFAGVAAITLLADRGYRPVEISNVMYQALKEPVAKGHSDVTARVAARDEAEVWTDLSVRGWTYEHPELLDFLLQTNAVFCAREHSVNFIAEAGGVPGAAGALCIHEGIALFAGAATVPEMRRRGLQAALLEERMRYAFLHGCDLAVMVAEAGSNSQRNAERKGFKVAYTRTKWRLSVPTVDSST